MGEPACLMQPFSYAAGVPNETQEGNPIHALGQSISFGRFMSDSLAWEKWSTFSHNRYVEEAERYSRPGSVAQKKAFFEAHYKKLAAARKAAALLEQANAVSNNAPESEIEGKGREMEGQDTQLMSFNSQESVQGEEIKEPNIKTSLVVNANGLNSRIVMVKCKSSKEEVADLVTEQKVLVENSMRVDSLNKLGVSDNNEAKDLKLNGTTEKENYAKCESSKVVDSQQSSNTNQDEDSLSTSKKKPSFSSSKSSNYGKASKLLSSPAKPTAPARSKKEINCTPMRKKSATDILSDKRRSTPKSSHKSYNFTPAKELNRLTSTIIPKLDGSRVGSNFKTSKECSTPLRTPNTASVSRVAKQSLATPLSENRSARIPFDSSTLGSKTVRPRWHFLPTDCSKFLSACRNKSCSPSLFKSFGLRTEERAAKRKEKLEEKFKAIEAQKQQQQATLKEKAEMELRKLRQNLCFKARPLPDFYKERGTPKNQIKKVPLTHRESPALGRKPSNSNTSIVQNKTSHPPQRSSIKIVSSKYVLENDNQSSTRSLTSQPNMAAGENMSSNIQFQHG